MCAIGWIRLFLGICYEAQSSSPVFGRRHSTTGHGRQPGKRVSSGNPAADHDRRFHRSDGYGDRALLRSRNRQVGRGAGAFLDAGFFQPGRYEASVAKNRARFARIISLVDGRVANPELEYIATTSRPAKLADTEKYTVYAVRWPVFDGVHGEGLLVQPKGSIRARIVALPDADQTPETIAGLVAGVPREFQYARRLAENGCLVIVPSLLDRSQRMFSK